jgi:hypothetical protein
MVAAIAANRAPHHAWQWISVPAAASHANDGAVSAL